MRFGFWWLVCTSCLALGCGSDSAKEENDPTETPENPPEVSTSATAESTGPASESVAALADVKQVMQMFVEDDPTLDLSLGAIENAGNVETRLSTVLATACPTVTVQHERGSTEVSANLDDCALESGLSVSGEVSASISRREVGQDAGLTVLFTFTQLTFGDLVVDGSVSVTTTDLTSYPIVADLEMSPLGHLTFGGTAALTVDEPIAVILNGTGQFVDAGSNSAKEVSANGWDCAGGSPSVLTVTNLHRVYGDCHADAGNIDVTRNYACSKVIRSQTVNQTVEAQIAMTWTSSTPADDRINAELTTTMNGQKKTGPSTPVTLPWSCD